MPKERAFQALAILLAVVLLESVLLGVLWLRWRAAVAREPADALTIPAGNLIRQAYPEVDFSFIYPGQSPEEIDLIQREAFALPYRYEAFTGFCITPTNGRTVTVTDAGFRVGAAARPWPPDQTAINVFVFGGSTTFGCGVAGRDTHVRMVIALMREWDFQLLIIGQPVPFFEFPRTPATYPFPLPTRQHPFAAAAYDRFRQRAASGEFGAQFLWCGDAFASAQSVMYADSIHYSPEGNRVLARVIVERARQRGLLKL
ncbi:MAG: hypothetical protein EB082_19350 [Verrucomicrobia bacterium]|nr:hypothetical protein [Verrucomicrobiota bacterium]